MMYKEEIKLKRFLTKYNTEKSESQKKYKFLNNFLSLFNDQLKLIDSIIKNLNTQYISILDEEDKKNDIYSIIKLIIENYQLMINSDKQLIKEIIFNLTTLIDNIKKENKKYDIELESIYNNMKEEKEKLEKKKKKFFQSIEGAELYVLDQAEVVLKKKQALNQSIVNSDILKDAKNDYINYMSSIDKVNKIISLFNDKEKKMLDGLNNIDNNHFFVLSIVLNQFYENQCTKNNLSSKNKNIIRDLIIINNNKLLNKKTKNDESVYNKFIFDFLKFENFPSKIDFFNIGNINEFKKSLYTVEMLNDNIGIIYPNFSVEKEIIRNELREKIKNVFFNLDYKILDQDKNEFFELIKNNEENQRLFLSELNRLRINGNHKRNKDNINLIGSILNIILDSLSVNENFETTKNCIILSQTFYYENDKKEKIYVYELIKNNKNVHNEGFWKYFIDILISTEFLKLQKNYEKQNINIFMKNNISKKMSDKIEELLFAQIAPSINNMIEFNIDKYIIVKIFEEIIIKYDYLGQDKIDCIYNLISNDRQEIEKIKNEIKKQNNILNIKQSNSKENNIIQINNIEEEKNVSDSIKNNEQNKIFEIKDETEGKIKKNLDKKK